MTFLNLQVIYQKHKKKTSWWNSGSILFKVRNGNPYCQQSPLSFNVLLAVLAWATERKNLLVLTWKSQDYHKILKYMFPYLVCCIQHTKSNGISSSATSNLKYSFIRKVMYITTKNLLRYLEIHLFLKKSKTCTEKKNYQFYLKI